MISHQFSAIQSVRVHKILIIKCRRHYVHSMFSWIHAFGSMPAFNRINIRLRYKKYGLDGPHLLLLSQLHWFQRSRMKRTKKNNKNKKNELQIWKMMHQFIKMCRKLNGLHFIYLPFAVKFTRAQMLAVVVIVLNRLKMCAAMCLVFMPFLFFSWIFYDVM